MVMIKMRVGRGQILGIDLLVGNDVADRIPTMVLLNAKELLGSRIL